ncbi:DNA repair protein [Marinobacter nauticus]|jgi:chromosome segregation ATPase|uniref:DNA repair protein n=1 Tax=Marinobacter nauticus TaxID=2743 RepID=UPI00241F4EE9|nr:DNA repair protein [Marinobacter nauticus]
MIVVENIKAKWLPAAAMMLAVSLPGLAPAQQSSLEERLRSELRGTIQQLNNLQSRQANLEAARANAEAQLEAAHARIAKLEGQIDAGQNRMKALQRSSAARVAASQERAEQVRSAYDELLQLARNKEIERLNLAQTLQQREAALQTCVGRNEEMYRAGKDILAEYENLGAGSLFMMRQPLATSSRVEFENRAQDLGDRLYNAQVQVVRAEESGDDATDQ